MGFPRLSIAEVMRLAKVTPQEIDAVAVASKWGHFYNEHVDFTSGLFGVERGFIKGLFFAVGAKLSCLRTKVPILEKLYYALRKPVYARRRDAIRQVLQEELGFQCPVEFIGHHFAHACSAYYTSGFHDALVVTMDASGDGCSSQVYEVTNGKWRKLHQVASFDSLGSYYAYITHICGFTAGKHEGKITGLAAHGKDRYRDILNQFITYHDGTMTNVGNVWFTAAVEKLKSALPSPFSREDLASSVQTLSEEICTQYVSYWLAQTGKTNVALAGGVFANVKINERIHELPSVQSVYIHPGMSDEGLAVGALLGWMSQHSQNPSELPTRCLNHVYLGPEYSDQEIADALDSAGVTYTHHENYDEEIAKCIAEGYVVARFAGRMEYGPRSLGNRSILYRPDDPAANKWLNDNLKRTEFMPFAPATLIEDADECYLGLDGARDTARFMTITFMCTQDMQDKCPGVVHVDGTARPQLVSEEDNPSYYRIIKAFKRMTGLSSVVNTSFNIHEEPIVCSPQDAIRAFQVGHLDYLAIGPFLARNPQLDEAGQMRSRRAVLVGQA